MKRIGLVTSWRDNYGSILQCFSTKTFLSKYRCYCDVIYEKPKGFHKIKFLIRNYLDLILSFLFKRGFLKNYFKVKSMYALNKRKLSEDSKKECDNFIKLYIQPHGISLEEAKIMASSPMYDYFVVGSDQIWNTDIGRVGDFAFLQFSPAHKNITLSPSFGTTQISKYCKNKVKKYLNRFSKITVREFDGEQLIKKITGKDATVFSDPVVLLSCSEWSSFLKKIDFQNYLLVHFIDEPSELVLSYLKSIDNMGKLIIAFGYYHEAYKNLKNIVFIDGGPFEYLSYIKCASTVFTDSFHTSQFSIILNTNFYVFNRQYQFGQNQSSRIKNLLKSYSLEHRLVTSENENIDYSNGLPNDIQITLNKYRQSLRSYLLDSLHIFANENKLKDMRFCTGCGACIERCPTGALGFLKSDFSHIVEKNRTKCINCSLCEKVCKERVYMQLIDRESYVGFSKSSSLLNKSASGGVFSSLALEFIRKGGIVFGTTLSFNNGPKVSFQCITDEKDLYKIQGSIYVESNISDCFLSIKNTLEKGKLVLVGALSCQIDGLNRYLDKSYNNLLTIDLICHGVPSISFFEKYISFLEKKYHSKVKEFSFRNKDKSCISYEEKILFEASNKQKMIRIPYSKSFYYRTFLAGDSYVENCYSCAFKGLSRPSDITIGDYFEAKNDLPNLSSNFNVSNGISAILINTKKGSTYFKEYSRGLYTHVANSKNIIFSHEQLCSPSRSTFNRFKLLTYKRLRPTKIINYYYLNNFFVSIKAFLSKIRNNNGK